MAFEDLLWFFGPITVVAILQAHLLSLRDNVSVTLRDKLRVELPVARALFPMGP